MSSSNLSRRRIMQDIDPIFAAIERHKSAVVAADAASDDLPPELADEDAAAARSLMATVPKTRAGLLALLRYVRAAEEKSAISLAANGDQLSALLSTIECAVSQGQQNL